LSEHAPRLKSAVIEQHVLSPPDLERLCGFPQGQHYHAELALDQVLWMRPVPELARYRTPVSGLYLCGPAMHPGGGIAGAAGANAARTIVNDLRKQKPKE
jgi:phytoene dehydrogenase-like protein